MFKIEVGETAVDPDDLRTYKKIVIKVDLERCVEVEAQYGKVEGRRLIKEEIIKFMNSSFDEYVGAQGT